LHLAEIRESVSVNNAYGIVGQLTFLYFQGIHSNPSIDSKQKMCTKTKLQLAQSIVEELVAFGFKIELVLADSLYVSFIGSVIDYYEARFCDILPKGE